MENIFNTPPFAISQEDKERLLLKRLLYLTSLHEKKSIQYKNILNALSFNKDNVKTILDIPFIPVGIFKERELLSTNKKDIIKTMTSSGTTGQAVSKIYLDKNTALLQQKALSKIVTNFLGPKRLPMLIIDSSEIIKNRELFSARGAGILGFSIFGKDINYALEKDMSLNIKTIDRFLQKYKNEKTFLFGFTFIVYDKFLNEIKKLKTKQNFIGEHKIQAYQDLFQNAILIHGGGWKRLISNAISPAKLKSELKKTLGIKSVYDYYGMVEQTGAIYIECEYGHLHASVFSDIIIRNYKDFSEQKIGKAGIIQVLSSLPESYPGHSLLTEDEGVLLGIDDCPCGRKGKYFKVIGRLKNAEIRGCSDTFS